MILAEANGKPAATVPAGRATLDDLFRRAATRRPDATALIDPPDRERFTHGVPRQLTYAQADRMIAAIAGRLRRIGLPVDAIVGLQMANTVESVLTLLGVLRAGLIAMPLPLLWRRADAVAALSHVGASALVVTGRVGSTDGFDLALQVAAEVFPIRYVCGFGRNPPEGIVPLDELYTTASVDPIPSIERERALPPGPGAHLALVTWDVSPQGLVPVARSHSELIAGGLAFSLETPTRQDAVILSALMLSSFAGIAASLMPWLNAGGTLALHHPFDADAFLTQREMHHCDTVILPGPALPQLAEAGHLAAGNSLENIFGVWRAPERLARAPTWCESDVVLTDIQVFGETGFLVGRRGTNGRPVPPRLGAAVRHNGNGAAAITELSVTRRGTLAIRGAMVPRYAFPPGAERTALPFFRVADDGFADTGYPCRADHERGVVAVVAPPHGLASVGGYRFVVRDVEDTFGALECDATLAVLPDALGGHQLAGSTPDPNYAQEALVRLGVNPLLVEAFRARNRMPEETPPSDADCGDSAAAC